MAEIKISDLSVGDWVMNLYANKPSRVIGLRTMFQDTYEIIAVSDDTQFMLIEDNKELHNFEPIPLTTDILEKNGLEYEDDGNDAVIFLCCDMFWARLCVGDTFWQVGIHSEDRLDAVVCNVKHTHQLQHALRLAGVEKEIEV
jgi:hypothetical protein